MANCQFAFIAESDFDGYLWTPLISITRHAAAQIFVHFLPAGVEQGGKVVPGLPIVLCQWKQVGYKQKQQPWLRQLTLDGFLGLWANRAAPDSVLCISVILEATNKSRLREPLKGAESVLKNP